MSALDELLLTPCDVVASGSTADPLDAVIVGGGPAGLTAACSLLDLGLRVAVLEAGPFALSTHALSTDLRFSGGAVRTLQRALSYSPALGGGGTFGALVSCVGGRGLFWNGAAPRFLPDDFSSWPLGYADLRTSYDWAERVLFVTTDWGRTKLGEALRRMLRLVAVDADPEPFAVDAATSINGWLSGTIGNPLTLLLRSGHWGPDGPRRVSVSANTFACRVDCPPGEEMAGVIARDRITGRDHVITGRSVVLAAGGLESVRLAISSALPDASGLMGRRVRDHWFVRGYFPLSPELYDKSLPEAAALLVRPHAGQPFQIEVHAPGRLFFHAHAGGEWRPALSDAYAAMVRAFAPTQDPDGHVEVTSHDQPGGYTVHIRETPGDVQLRASMVAGLERVREGLGASRAQIEQYPLGASYHEAGGLCMGATKDDGVVDRDGRFFGERRVVVADASAWPAIGCANPHLSIVAIARRQAMLLAERLQAGVL